MFEDSHMPHMGVGEGAGLSVAVAIFVWTVAKIKTVFEAAKNVVDIVVATFKFFRRIVTFLNEWEERAALLAEHEKKLKYLEEIMAIDYEETWDDDISNLQLSPEEIALIKTLRASSI
jgi:regulator of PEP synthase PpsR (kinase-PPPase family)